MRLFFDSVFRKDGELSLIGWAAPDKKEYALGLSILHKDGRPFEEAKVEWCLRPDIGYALFHDPGAKHLGLYLKIPYPGNETFVIRLTETEDGRLIGTEDRSFTYAALFSRMQLKKAKASLKGPIDFGKKVYKKLTKEDDKKYQAWFLKLRASEAELESERREVFTDPVKFSILTPVYHTEPRYLNEMIDSVLSQTYPHFELILCNADPEDEKTSEILKKRASEDRRIIAVDLPENYGISGNTNEALKKASGDFIALLDHDDVLEPDALYVYADSLRKAPETDVLYSDEDKITEDSGYFFFPYFKSDYNPDMLLCNNYICHFLAMRRTLIENAGGWDPEFDGAQDHDLLLRLMEKTDCFTHVPRILYHWRSYSASTAKKHKNKSYAQDAGVRALEAHYRRTEVKAAVETGMVPGWYVTKRVLETEPLVSILIPNKDHVDDLRKCVDSLYTVNSYRNFEILIIENNSTEDTTFRYYDAVTAVHRNIRVLKFDGGFNFSAINNLGAREAKGDYFLLLNNDVEVISPDFLSSMLSLCMREGTGAVGCKLLYPDDTVQHAGVLVGAGGLASHMFKGLRDTEPGYFARAVTTQNVSAVTAACLLVSKRVYDEVGGLDEAYQVAFNDVDFCLKIREKGYRIVYDADVKLYHYESKSRGTEDTLAKVIRAGEEMDRLNLRWQIQAAFEADAFTDPYYNPNLSYLEFFEPDYKKTSYG